MSTLRSSARINKIAQMILITLFLSLASVQCLPQNRRLLKLGNTTPEQVNSLEAEESAPRPNFSDSATTVEEVERILQQDPTLPRLTRGEIYDLLENITKSGKLPGPRKQKAVMVVMPYTPSKDVENMEDLYTKAPITQIIGGEPGKTTGKKQEVTSTPRSPVRRRRPPTTEKPTVFSAPPEPTQRTRGRRPSRRTTTTTPKTVEKFLPSDGITVVRPPSIPEEFEHQADTKHEVFMKPEPTLADQINIPEHLRNVMKDLNVESAMNPNEAAKLKLEQRLKSTIDEQNRLKNVLMSMGVLAESTTVPSAEVISDSLNPEMKDLLISFGLLPDSRPKTEAPPPEVIYPETAEINPSSYIGFKPLPNDAASTNEMEALLASFGLGRSARKEKALNPRNTTTYNLDVIPDDLKNLVEEMGLQELNTHVKKKIESSTSKQHVFNPDAQNATEEQLEKLDKLLSLVRQLEKINGSVTDDDLKAIDFASLKELVSSLNITNTEPLTLEDSVAPDPTYFDIDLIKNEVKRQEATTVSTTTTEAETPSIKDLEDSFGGEAAPANAEVQIPEVPETTTRKTGFYYLLDWNTFLDIDDTKGKRVNLRFQPTVGDPKRFYSISTP